MISKELSNLLIKIHQQEVNIIDIEQVWNPPSQHWQMKRISIDKLNKIRIKSWWKYNSSEPKQLIQMPQPADNRTCLRSQITLKWKVWPIKWIQSRVYQWCQKFPLINLTWIMKWTRERRHNYLRGQEVHLINMIIENLLQFKIYRKCANRSKMNISKMNPIPNLYKSKWVHSVRKFYNIKKRILEIQTYKMAFSTW